MAEAKIRSVQRVPTLDAARAGQMDTLVSYDLQHGSGLEAGRQRFTVRIHQEEPDNATIQETVRQDARRRAQLLDQSIQV